MGGAIKHRDGVYWHTYNRLRVLVKDGSCYWEHEYPLNGLNPNVPEFAIVNRPYNRCWELTRDD